MTTICAGPTNTPTQGLRYRVIVSVPRVLDSAILEQTLENIIIPTGTIPSSAVLPFTMTASRSFPRETRMENMNVTPIADTAGMARIQGTVIVPMELDIVDSNGVTFHTYTNYTYEEDIVLFVPENSSFPHEITSECVTISGTGIGDRNTITVSKLCTRIVTRVTADTDLLIPCYGYAPINSATNYEDPSCREFFNQPLFPNGKASRVCGRN
jgi:hypothetical protein